MVILIPNQPATFGQEANSCSCDSESTPQLVDNTDTTQFQFELTPCGGAENIITDPDFNDPGEWDLEGNWSIAYNQLCITSDGIINSNASTGLIFDNDGYYEVTIVVDSITDGSIAVVFNDGFDVVELGTISVAGTYTFYGVAIGGPPTLFKAYLSVYNVDLDVNCCISSLTAFQILADLKFVIKDAVNNDYKAQISYQNTPDYFTIVKNTITVTIDWAELGVSNGCYYVCLLDPCVNTNGQNYPIVITNPNFTGNANGWTFGGEWTYNSNAIDWSIPVTIPPLLSPLSQTIFPTYSQFNDVEIIVTAISGTLKVYFGNTLVETITTIGTHLVSGIPTDSLDLILIPTGTGTLTSVNWTASDFNDYVCDSSSNTFKLGSYADECTLLINVCNDNDGLGFVFDGSGFSPRVRLESKLKQPKYPSERSIYEDSAGDKSVTYYKRRKAKLFCFDLQPEYIHDFLSLLVGIDNVYIDDTLYFVEDEEYVADYNEANDSLGSVKLLVSERVQNVVNTNCSSVQSSCNLNEQGIVRVFLDNVLVSSVTSNNLNAEVVDILWT